MPRWTCPRCEREFDRPRQAHTCHPGNSIERTFQDFPSGHLQICAAVIDCLRGFGPVHVDPVLVGVFLKTQRKLAEVRPMRRWVYLLLVLPDVLDSPRVSRSARISEIRVMHWIKLYQPADVDAELREWLEEAYEAASW